MRAQVRTVCVQPVRILLDVEGIEPRRVALEKQLEQQVRRSGFTVVAGDAVDEVWMGVVGREGGYFDPHTGWRNEERFEAISRLARSEVRRELGCDAILISAVVPVVASFIEGTISWDGVRESYRGSHGSSGWVAALSLHVRLLDMADREIYFFAGGIQPLLSIDRGFFSSSFRSAEVEQLLADEGVRLRAVNLALEPLLPEEVLNPPETVRNPELRNPRDRLREEMRREVEPVGADEPS